MLDTTEARIGRYTILKPIAVGGMAVVYLCERTGPGGFKKQLVAKVIRADLVSKEEQKEMFLAEARIAASLEHPHIAQIFEIDWAGATPYIIMEHVRGPSLWRLVRRAEQTGAVSLPHVALVSAQIARGLHLAHFRGAAGGASVPPEVVHRDVSLQNILVSLDGVSKLIDFGIARDEADSTERGVTGKLPYLAPERIRRLPSDHRADIYALGVALYRASTGRFPFGGSGLAEILKEIYSGRLVKPSELVPTFPAALEEIICRMLRVEPEDRYATCAEVASDLEDFCANQPSSPDARSLGAYVSEIFPRGEEEWILPPSPMASLTLSLLSSPPRERSIASSWFAQRSDGFLVSLAILAVGTLMFALGAAAIGLLLSSNAQPELSTTSHPSVPISTAFVDPVERTHAPALTPEPIGVSRQLPMGIIEASGDADIVLTGPDGESAAPGRLRAGLWRFRSKFGERSGPSGEIDLRPGQIAAIRCSSFAMKCRVDTR